MPIAVQRQHCGDSGVPYALQVTLNEEGSQPASLEIIGLTQYGYLRAVDIHGTEYALHPDGNR